MLKSGDFRSDDNRQTNYFTPAHARGVIAMYNISQTRLVLVYLIIFTVTIVTLCLTNIGLQSCTLFMSTANSSPASRGVVSVSRSHPHRGNPFSSLRVSMAYAPASFMP